MPGALLCPSCAGKLPYIDLSAACPFCGAPNGWLTCTECTDSHPPGENWPPGASAEPRAAERASPFPFSSARAALSYDGVARRLVSAYKDGGERRCDKLLAGLLLQTIRAQSPQKGGESLGLAPVHDDWAAWADTLVAIPSRPEAIRSRGFDHMRRVAALVSEWSGLPLVSPLVHAHAVEDQRALGAEKRMENLSGSFSLAEGANVAYAKVLLVDDVLTTGATVSAASEALLFGGASEIRVAVVTRVVK